MRKIEQAEVQTASKQGVNSKKTKKTKDRGPSPTPKSLGAQEPHD